jgi:enamine deaminase RidA (YjgF/YER057c/UK114 family)
VVWCGLQGSAMADRAVDRIRFVNPPDLPAPPGYSHVVEVRGGRLIFIAGQAAIDRDGHIVGTGDFAAQAAQAFRNLAAALAAVGCSARNLVKLTVFLRDMNRLADYRRAAPAITLIEVSKLFADELLIEIEGVAAADDER